jgi:hypothetical protein
MMERKVICDLHLISVGTINFSTRNCRRDEEAEAQLRGSYIRNSSNSSARRSSPTQSAN